MKFKFVVKLKSHRATTTCKNGVELHTLVNDLLSHRGVIASDIEITVEVA